MRVEYERYKQLDEVLLKSALGKQVKEGDTYGIRLIAESEEDAVILNKFHESGLRPFSSHFGEGEWGGSGLYKMSLGFYDRTRKEKDEEEAINDVVTKITTAMKYLSKKENVVDILRKLADILEQREAPDVLRKVAARVEEEEKNEEELPK